MRAEDVAKHLRQQAERGILGLPDDFPIVGFTWAADVIEALIAERDQTMKACEEIAAIAEDWRYKFTNERERCAAIARSADRPGRNTGSLIAEEIMK